MPTPRTRVRTSIHATSSGTCRQPNRHWLAVAAVLLAALAVASLPARTFAAGPANSSCVKCHALGSGLAGTREVGFDVAPVARASACRKCHWEASGSHPYHMAGWNCGSCHAGWGALTPGAVPKYYSSALGAYFDSPQSEMVSTATLHSIHAKTGWIAGVTKNGRQCGSCHSAAACTACHEASVEPTHGDHTWSVALGGYAPGTGPSAARFGSGTTPGNEFADSVESSLTCSNPVCHEIGSPAAQPFLIDDADAAVVYSVAPAWSRSSMSGYLGSTLHAANAAGARADVRFAGRKAELLADRGLYRGKARILVDSVEATTIDLYSASDQKQVVVFESLVLASGDHTLTVEVLGEKSASARATYVLIDAVRVYPSDQASRTPCSTCHPSQHAALHPNVTPSCGGEVGCHNEASLTVIHDAVGCACHESARAEVVAAVGAQNKACTACHNAMKTHGAVHEASPAYAAPVIFPGRTGAGAGAYTIKCLSCHRTNLLADHGTDYTNCSMCHAAGGPRSTVGAWDKTCQTGVCHPGSYAPHLPTHTTHYHERMSIGEQPNGMCQSCHGNPEGWQCGSPFGCHNPGMIPVTSVDFTPPVTVAARSGSDPIVWRLTASDAGDGVAATYYSFDGGPYLVYGAAQQLDGIVNPADASAPFSHTLRYYSVDNAGNTEAAGSTTYDITDITPPVVTFNGINGTPVGPSIQMLVTDPKVKGLNTGVASVHVEVMAYNPYWGSWSIQQWWSLADYSWPLDGTWDSTRTIVDLQGRAQTRGGGNYYTYKDYGNGSGRFQIQYYARDYAGNQSAMQYADVWIDNWAPNTSIAQQGAAWRWKFTAYDDTIAGVDKTYYSFDGGPFLVYTAADNVNGVVNPGGDTSGPHTIRYYSTDVLGHVEATKTFNYTIP